MPEERPKPDLRIPVLAGDGPRLDKFLADQKSGWSRTALQRLIESGGVLVNGRPVAAHHKLQLRDVIDIWWPVAAPISTPPRKKGKLPFPIIAEDDAILVVDKPAGLVVHPAAGHRDGNTLVEILAPWIGPGPWPDAIRPGLVHRLDRDTTGVMVLAKTPAAHAELSRQFADREVKKTYLALARGLIEEDKGELEAPIGRDPGQRQRFAVSIDGRWASTRFRVKERLGDIATLLEMTPMTGRTHQIRVHLAGFGHPVVGDHIYGGADRTFAWADRQMLHAAVLEIIHPVTRKKRRFEAPLPADFRSTIKLIRSKT